MSEAEIRTVRLHKVAHARAGDKGNISNIAVICYSLAAFPYVESQITADAVCGLFAYRNAGAVRRYGLPLLGAFNFVIEDVLEGGVNGSLNLDGHGKALSFMLLGLRLAVPIPVLEACARSQGTWMEQNR